MRVDHITAVSEIVDRDERNGCHQGFNITYLIQTLVGGKKKGGGERERERPVREL